MKTSNESGSHVIALALGLVFVAVVGFAGYRVYQMQLATNGATDTKTTATVPAKITNTASLNQAASVLDQSSAQVNSNLDDNALNDDLSNLL